VEWPLSAAVQASGGCVPEKAPPAVAPCVLVWGAYCIAQCIPAAHDERSVTSWRFLECGVGRLGVCGRTIGHIAVSLLSHAVVFQQ